MWDCGEAWVMMGEGGGRVLIWGMVYILAQMKKKGESKGERRREWKGVRRRE